MRRAGGFLLVSLFLLASGLTGWNGVGASQAAPGDPTRLVYLPLVQNAPTPTPTPIPAPEWLAYLNARRALAVLPPLQENPSWSDGCWKHARYMVKNDVIGHDEDPAAPWYTPEGDAAAGNSNVMVSSSASYSDQRAIDLWLTGPFHGVGVLDPQLASTGFGSYREADGGWQMGACLDVLRGLGALPDGVSFPIRFPADGMAMPYLAYTGGEYPDPIKGCGYAAPTGAPIYLMIGSGNLTPNVSAHSFRRDGANLEHCVYTETTFTLPGDPSGESLGRAVLNGRDAVVLIPRQPLSAGATYVVSITVNGVAYTWSFTTSAAPSQADRLLEAEEVEMR